MWHDARFSVYGWMSRILTTILFATCRIEVVGQGIEQRYLLDNPGRGPLYASWHRGLAFLVYFYRGLRFVVMASTSRDGQLAVQFTKSHGWIPVYGSSTSRGMAATREMMRYLKKGHRGGLLVDAPQGPAYTSKPGIVALARWTGLPLLPVMWSADKYWRLNSWDQTIIPKPFSRIVFMYGDGLISIPPNASREDDETYRQELDDTLNRLMLKADSYYTAASSR